MGPADPTPLSADFMAFWRKEQARIVKRLTRKAGQGVGGQMPRRNTPKADRRTKASCRPQPGGRRPRHLPPSVGDAANLTVLLGHPPRGRKR